MGFLRHRWMTLTRSRSVLLAVLMLAPMVTVISTATPAYASHDWIAGHWYAEWYGETPAPPIWDRNNTYRRNIEGYGDDYVFNYSSARWRWGSNGAIRPWLQYVGGDPWDCNPQAWMVVVCVGHPGYDSGGRPLLGSMTPYYFDNQLHLIATVIRINPYHNWSDTEQLVNVGTHELGHALGLGHQYCGCPSVMNPQEGGATSIRWPNGHDFDAIRNMYIYHAH